jgi:hypothetical protein
LRLVVIRVDRFVTVIVFEDVLPELLYIVVLAIFADIAKEDAIPVIDRIRLVTAPTGALVVFVFVVHIQVIGKFWGEL